MNLILNKKNIFSSVAFLLLVIFVPLLSEEFVSQDLVKRVIICFPFFAINIGNFYIYSVDFFSSFFVIIIRIVIYFSMLFLINKIKRFNFIPFLMFVILDMCFFLYQCNVIYNISFSSNLIGNIISTKFEPWFIFYVLYYVIFFFINKKLFIKK